MKRLSSSFTAGSLNLKVPRLPKQPAGGAVATEIPTVSLMETETPAPKRAYSCQEPHIHTTLKNIQDGDTHLLPSKPAAGLRAVGQPAEQSGQKSPIMWHVARPWPLPCQLSPKC